MFVQTLRRKFEGKESKVKIVIVICSLLIFSFLLFASTGEFFASGKRGWVKFFAQKGYVEVEGKGKLWVKTSADSKAEIEGTYDSKEKDKGMDFYKNFQGKVFVKGLNFRVEFRGENIKFHATGKGKAAMQGDGTYKTDKEKEGKWGIDYRWAHTRF